MAVLEDFEIDRWQIQLVHKVGAGQFGEVWEGLWNNTTSVAVKILKPETTLIRRVMKEVRWMKKLRHAKLIYLYAVCTKPIYIVTELMKHGSLMDYLRHGEGQSLKQPQLIDMAEQVASGMAYLEEQNHMHQFLAARNILVGENLICKVADFGLARVFEKQATFSIKWMAPEAALYNRFSIKSDVWSFGIVMYEIITYGRSPNPGMTNEQVLEGLQQGYHMPRPFGCPEKLHDIMMDCWQDDLVSRPTFKSLQVQLEDFWVDDTGDQKVHNAQ